MSKEILFKKFVEILKDAGKYPDSNDYTFLTAYQLAVILRNEPDFGKIQKETNCPQNIGGEGEGEHSSLAQYIARWFAGNDGYCKDEVEQQFFNTKAMIFTFTDENGNDKKKPSVDKISMFRYRG